MASDLNWLLLAEIIVVVIVASAFLFYWNRLGGSVVAWLIRLYAWRRHNAYIAIGSLQISPLAGRIAFRDIQYHSSNLSVRALHGHVTFRYWWARVRQEGDAQSGNAKRQKLPSRIMVNLEGVEMFVFNRTPAYDNIVERMKKHERDEAAAAGKTSESDGPDGPVKENPITLRLRKVYKAATAGKGGDEERLESVNSNDSASSESAGKVNDIPNIIRPADPPTSHTSSSVDWFREMLPVDIRVQTGSVILGSDATPMLLIGSFKRAEGKLEITDSRSICDKYKMIVDLRFEKPKVIYRTNKEYSGPLLAHGKKVYDKVVSQKPDITKEPPSRMSSRPAFQALARMFAFIRDPDFSVPPIQGLPTDRTWKGLPRYQEHVPSHKPFVESKEYAKVSTLLDTPLLELTYFADTPGPVPDRSEILKPDDQDEFGNIDLPPEYGIDINIYGGTVNYGPWADRQRDALQRAFAPSIFFNTEPLAKLRKGDTRIHSNLALKVEICSDTTLRIPTRDPSRDWRFAPEPDAKATIGSKPSKVDRSYAWLEVKVGANSSVIYSQAQYATKSGYDSMVVLHLDSLKISSSVNGLNFISARACKLSVTMPTPLEWNAQRNWGLDVTLENPKVALLRDHVTLISDLSRDWSSGAAADYHHFVPMHYNFRVTLLNYDVRLYINDNNIIDNPESIDENAFMVLTGPRLDSYVSVDAARYRPETSVIPFSVSLDDAKVALSLPTWDTHYTFTCADDGSGRDISRSLEIGKIGRCAANGTYRYFSNPHPDHQETLILNLDAERVAFKCLGWVLRRLFCIKDNYFGMFTQFSQSAEFLHRHAADPKSVGDPVEEKYHPGRSDALAVHVILDVRDSLILLSDEIYACTSGLAMPVPQFQMMLKSLEAFMEMSLDAPPTSIVPASDLARVYDTLQVYEDEEEAVLVEGLSIKANRLFGPQPRGATYLCLWEASLPRVSVNLTPSLVVTLLQSVKAVAYNFVDHENAPTKLYLPQSDPDVTFFKLSLESVSVTLVAGNAAAVIDLPQGINLDISSLATLTSVSSVGIVIPEVDIALRSRPSSASKWTTTASIRSGLGVDIYNNPEDGRKQAGEQQQFIRQQDEPTKRIWYMYADSEGGRTGYHAHTVFLPKPRVFVTDEASESASTTSDSSILSSTSSSSQETKKQATHGMPSGKSSFVTAKERYSDSEFSDTSDSSEDAGRVSGRKLSSHKALYGDRNQSDPSAAIHGGVIVRKGLSAASASSHGRLVRLRLRPIYIHASAEVVHVIGGLVQGMLEQTPRSEQMLDNLLDSQVDKTLAGVVTDTPFTLDATFPILHVKLDTVIDSSTTSFVGLHISDAAMLLRSHAEPDHGPEMSGKIAALALGLDAATQAYPTVHLGHVDPRYDGVHIPLVRLEHRGVTVGLTKNNQDSVVRLAVSATDARLVTAAGECALRTSKTLKSILAKTAFGSNSRRASQLIRGIIRPDVLGRSEFTELRPIFASVKSSPLHKEDDRNIRLNHGWRILSQLRVMYASLVAVEDKVTEAEDQGNADVEDFCARLGSLDWFEEPAYALTLNQPFVQQMVAQIAGESGEPVGEISTTVTLSSDILSARHYDRLLGEKSLGVNSVVVTGISLGAILKMLPSERDVRLFGAIKSVGIDIRDSIFGLIKAVSTALDGHKPTGNEQARTRETVNDPGVPTKITCDVHLANGGIDVTAGGLRLTTIAEQLHTIIVHNPMTATDGPTSVSSLILTYEKTSFSLLALATSTGRREYPVIEMATEGLRVIATHQQDQSKPSNRMRLLVGLESLNFQTKAQLRSFLHYIHEWKDKHQPHYAAAIADLRPTQPDRPSGPPAANACTTTFTTDITLRKANVKIRAAKTVWVSWLIGKSYLCGNGSKDAFRIGVSLDPQEIKAVAEDEMAPALHTYGTTPRTPAHHDARLRLPSLKVTGSYNVSGKQRYVLANIGFGALTGKIKPVVLDRLLSLQQRLGADVRQIIKDYKLEASHLFEKEPKSHVVVEAPPILFDVSVHVALVRIALQAEKVPAAVLFEVLSMEGSASNRRTANQALAWHAKAHHLGLSLGALDGGPLSEKIEPTGRYRSVSMNLDVEIHEKPGDIRSPSQLSISLSKVHTVMHIAALSEISDLVSSWSNDLRVLKEKRAEEVAEVRARTSRILKRIEASERGIQPELSWFASRLLVIDINGFAVAVPLGKDMAIDLRPKNRAAAPAMLFSIRSINFQNRRNETARFRLQAMMLQFLPSFDQSLPTHFAGEYHQTDNMMSLPHIDAEAQMSSTAEEWTLASHSRATDFELKLTPSIVNHIFQLIDMYEQGREYVTQLEKHYFTETGQAEADLAQAVQAEKGKTAQRLICRMSFEFQSGLVHLVHHDAPGQGSGRRPSHKRQDTLKLPKISVWLEYAGPHRDLDGTAVVNMAVHGSHNELRPTILPFFVDIASRVERRAAQKHKARAANAKLPTSGKEELSAHPIASIAKSASNIIRVSATLRIDRSRLRLSDPDSQAYVDLEWESGGFLAKTTIGAEENSTFAGTISGVTTELSNSNEPENSCIKATARDMAVSVVFAPQWREDHSGISVVFDTKVAAQFNLDKFSSWLTFAAVWIDGAPTLDTPIAAAISDSTSATHVAKRPEKRKMGVAILARFQAVDFDAQIDVTHAQLSIKPIVLQTISDGQRTRIDLRIGVTEITAEGKVSGNIRSEYISFHTVRKSSRAADNVDPQLLNMSIDAGVLSGHLRLREQSVAMFRLEKSLVQLYDNWQDASAPPNLTFAVEAGRLTAVTRLQSIAELLERVYDVLDLIERQHGIANKRSEAFRNRAVRRHNEPSPIATALMQSMQKVGKSDVDGQALDFAQVMHFRIVGIDVGIFNNDSGQQVDELYRFVFGDLEAYLTRVPKKADGKEAQARDLRLNMGFCKWDSAEKKRWLPENDRPDLSPEEVITKIMGSRPKQVASLPSVNLHMDSTEDMAAAVLTYTLALIWGKTEGDVAILPEFFNRAITACKKTGEGIDHAEKRRWKHNQRLRPSDATIDEPNLKEIAARRFSATDAVQQKLQYISTIPNQQLPMPNFHALGSGTTEFFQLIGRDNLRLIMEELPKLAHSWVTLTLEEGMDLLLKLYAKQLPDRLT